MLAMTFGLSADYERRTGGYVYDERLYRELGLLGYQVDWRWLPPGFPQPNQEARRAVDRCLVEMPDRAIFLTDQLVSSTVPEVIAMHAARLRIVQMAHHPLAMEHGTPPGLAARRAAEERVALGLARLVICTSHATAELLHRDYGVPRARMVVAPPGIDAMPLAVGSRRDELQMLSVGAVVPRKAHDRLIQALAMLEDRRWHFIVGNLTRALEQVRLAEALLERHGLADRVTLTGELAGPNLAWVWTTSDLFVSASHLEGYGMALAEAEAHGLPILSTAAGAPAT